MTATPHSLSQVALFRLRAAFDALLGIPEADAPTKWVIEEGRVSRRMRPQLGPEIALAKDVETFAFEVMSSVASLRQPSDLFRAQATLTARSLHDLRVCAVACMSGYTMQGWTVAASAFEAAHMAGYIGEDAGRATQWLTHRDPERTLVKVKDAVIGTFKYLDIAADLNERQHLVDNEYELYSYLCLAKHVNPIPERYRYWVDVPNGTRLVLTPFYMPRRVREARLGLGLAARAALLASWVIAKANAPEFQSLGPRLASLATRTAQAVRDWKASADGDVQPPAAT